MFCRNCGREINSGEKFCTECGFPVAAEDREKTVTEASGAVETAGESISQAVENTAAEASEVEANVENAGVAPNYVPPQFIPPEQPGGYAPDFGGGEVKKSSKKKVGIVIGAILLALIAAAGIFFACNADMVRGWFMSPESLMQSAERTAWDGVKEGMEDSGKTFEKTKDLLSDYSAVMKVELGETAKSLINSSGIDFSWLNALSLAMNGSMANGESSMRFHLLLNDTELTYFDYILNSDKGEMILSAPELSDKAARFDLLEGLGGDYSEDDISEMIKSFTSLDAIAPDYDALGKIITKYSNIAIESIDEVKKDSAEITVEGITQKVTVLTAEYTEDELKDVGEKMLNEFKADEEVKSILEKSYSNPLLKEQLDYYDSFDEFYADFIDGIDDTLEDLTERSESGSENALTVTDYLNSKNEIVGRRIKTAEDDEFYYIEVRDGEKFAFESTINGKAFLSGSGTEKGGVREGTFDIKSPDPDSSVNIGTLTVSDLNVDRFNDGKPHGTFTFKPSKDLLERFSDDDDSGISMILSSLSIKFAVDSDGENTSMVISPLMGSDELLKITFDGKKGGAEKISVPDESDMIDASDEEEFENWGSGLDTGLLLSRLTEAGLPSEFISGLLG